MASGYKGDSARLVSSDYLYKVLKLEDDRVKSKLKDELYVTETIPSHYVLTTSGETGALEVIDDSASVIGDQIKLSDVSPIKPAGTIVNIGDYVLFVDETTVDKTKYLPRDEHNNESTNMEYEHLFGEPTTPTNYNGSENLEVNSDYLFKQFSIVIPKLRGEIKDIFSLTSNMTYTTFETKADLDSYDLTTITDGINIMLVKQDEGYPRPEVGDTACYSTIYLVIPKSDPTQNTAEFVAKLNMSEELIKKQLEEALNKALYVYTVDHYEVCLSSDDGALLIVADTATPSDGEIRLSDVTPIQPEGTVVNVGEYVKFVASEKTNVTKFIARNEIDVDTVSKLSTIEEEQDDGSKKEFLAFNGSKIETELQLDDVPTKDSDKFVNSGTVYSSLFTTKQRTVIDTPENYVVCQSTDTDALEVVADGSALTPTQVELSTVQAFVPTAQVGEYYQHVDEVNHLEDYEDNLYRLKDDSYSKEEVDAKITAASTGMESMTPTEFNDYFDNLVITASSIQTP